MILGDSMAKRRRPMTAEAKRRLVVLGPICILFIISFFVSLISYTANLHQLRKEKEQLDAQYTSLQEEAEQLRIEISKLQDPEELAKFARENYLYSKDGELIIKINENQEEIEVKQEKLEFNQNIIYMCGTVIILVFIYICLRGTRKKKSNE